MEFEVEITYTNGHKIRYWFEELTITAQSISWKLSKRYEGKVRFFKLNFDEIVTIIQTDVEEIE